MISSIKIKHFEKGGHINTSNILIFNFDNKCLNSKFNGKFKN